MMRMWKGWASESAESAGWAWGRGEVAGDAGAVPRGVNWKSVRSGSWGMGGSLDEDGRVLLVGVVAGGSDR